jgi:hypothetical protein
MHRAAHPADISYMSCRVIPVLLDGRETWRLAPFLGKCLPKLFWSCASGIRSAPLLFAHAIAQGATHLFAGDPLVSPFLRAFMAKLPPTRPRPRLCAAIRDTGVGYLLAGVADEPLIEPSPLYPVFYEARYGVPYDPGLLATASAPSSPLISPFWLPSEVIARDN